MQLKSLHRNLQQAGPAGYEALATKFIMTLGYIDYYSTASEPMPRVSAVPSTSEVPSLDVIPRAKPMIVMKQMNSANLVLCFLELYIRNFHGPLPEQQFFCHLTSLHQNFCKTFFLTFKKTILKNDDQ